jgi:hypothetical protein
MIKIRRDETGEYYLEPSTPGILRITPTLLEVIHNSVSATKLRSKRILDFEEILS